MRNDMSFYSFFQMNNIENNCFLGEIYLNDGSWGYVCMVCKKLYIKKDRDIASVKLELPYVCGEQCRKKWYETPSSESISGEEYFNLSMNYFAEHNLSKEMKENCILTEEASDGLYEKYTDC